MQVIFNAIIIKMKLNKTKFNLKKESTKKIKYFNNLFPNFKKFF